jgi:alkanesulfonate monooxygenase SsuD/methylene tetrahydromethanopterin reductase-like flavin-dependent oxidoreductase (luciferase family)
MLRLTGRKADGWLPSLGRLPSEQLAASNATIDEAARSAGRDPREIRRLGNLPAGMGAAEIAELALEHGFSTFILSSDEPAEIERFGQETAPAVRDAVARGRGSTGTAKMG